jgi:putative ABC transport system ATP-binding protein
MLRFQQVSKLYRTRRGEVKSLDALNLEVKTGEFLVIRGPSGCGKTTLLLTGGGMLRPSSGTVLFNGQNLYDLSPRQRAALRAASVGFVFQMFHLVPYLTVLENVLLGATVAPEKDLKTRASELLGPLGLSARAHHTPAQLSTGERQRTALARALLNRPQVILADEPTGNLDPANAGEVLHHLKQFHSAGGTVLLVTHGTAADSYADRHVEMQSGRIEGA